jgi:hypothetical protein
MFLLGCVIMQLGNIPNIHHSHYGHLCGTCSYSKWLYLKWLGFLIEMGFDFHEEK